MIIQRQGVRPEQSGRALGLAGDELRSGPNQLNRQAQLVLYAGAGALKQRGASVQNNPLGRRGAASRSQIQLQRTCGMAAEIGQE